MEYDDYDSYDGPLDYEGYQFLHRMEALNDANTAAINRQYLTLADLQKRMLDIEAKDFADRIERAVDLERWRGIYAAHVGHELEEIADKVMKVWEVGCCGGEADALLDDIYDDLMLLMGEIKSIATEADYE